MAGWPVQTCLGPAKVYPKLVGGISLYRTIEAIRAQRDPCGARVRVTVRVRIEVEVGIRVGVGIRVRVRVRGRGIPAE